MATQAAPNYDYLRRKSSNRLSSINTSPQRRPTRRDGERNSNGTISSVNSSMGRQSASTGLTMPPSYSKKFVVVGDGGCGKTCLLISYSQGVFPEVWLVTLCVHHILNPCRNTCRLFLRTTSHTQSTSPLVRPSNWHYGTLQGKKSTIVYDHSPTRKQIFCLSALPSTAPIRSRMSWTRYLTTSCSGSSILANCLLVVSRSSPLLSNHADYPRRPQV